MNGSTRKNIAGEGMGHDKHSIDTAVVDSLPEAVFSIDLEGRIVIWNRALEELTGFSKTEMLGKGNAEYAIPLYGERRPALAELVGLPDEDVSREYSSATRHGDVLFAETEAVCKDGRRTVLWLKAAPLRDSDGNVVGAIESILDVTHVRKERQMLFDALETLPVMVCIVRPDYQIPFANRAFREVFGESNGRPCYDYVFGQDGPCAFCQTLEALRTGAPHHWECHTPDGRIIDVHDFPFLDLDGTPSVLEVDVDITERRRSEEMLRESEERYRTLFENSQDAIFLTRPDGTILDANESACAMFGRSREEIVQLGRKGLVDETDPRLESLLKERSMSGRARGEITMVRSGARRFPAEVSSGIYRDSEGLQRTSLIVRDMTQRRRAQEALEASEHRYRTFLDSTSDLVFLKDEEMRYLFANKALLEYLGTTREEVIGTDDFGLVPEEVALQARCTDEETQRQRTTMVTEKIVGQRVYEMTKFPVTLTDGRIGIGAFVRDITERRRAEEKLEQKEKEIETLVNNTGDHIVRFDRDLRYLFMNRAAVELTGLPSHELLGKTPEESGMPGDLCRLFREKLPPVFETKSRQTFEFKCTGSDGIERTFQASVSPEIGSDGSVGTAVSSVRDVTDLKQLQEELERSQAELRRVKARLSEVEERERRRIARSLHDDLGQHLTALGINLNIMASILPKKTAAKVMPRIEDSLGLIKTAMNQVRHLITDLRNPVLEDYGLAAALEWYCKEFVGRAGIKVIFSGGFFKGRLDADRELGLFRIAQESLTNVIRHAGATEVLIGLHKNDDTIRLTIEDNGTGLPPEKDLGDRSVPDLHYWGFRIMRERAVSIGGSLRVESALGKGTRVVTEVPG